MQFSLTKFVFALMASEVAMATPAHRVRAPTDRNMTAVLHTFHREGSGHFELKNDGRVQRVNKDGTVTGSVQLTDSEIAKIKAAAGVKADTKRDQIPGTSKPRSEDTPLETRFGCAIGTWCHNDETCYFAGCDGCMYLPTGGGVCYGTTY
ncbi:hypothetical protein SCAR479_12539 [Seiridium cardinale]|uniref:Uncharacterized protein n=1 Tax=Seiridium cardinale TaxID=138064 RepID=A0ABR2XAC3_9PEZI